jgi:hypothetical protein
MSGHPPKRGEHWKNDGTRERRYVRNGVMDLTWYGFRWRLQSDCGE